MSIQGRRRAVAVLGAAILALQGAVPKAAWAQEGGYIAPADAINALRDTRTPQAGPLGGPPRIPLTSQTPPAGASEIRFVLTALELSGGTVYAPGALAPYYQDRIGQEIRLDALYEIAAELQARYRADGYLFNRVIVPAQSIEGGRARLEMLEAVLEEVTVEEPAGPLGPVRALAERIVAPLRGLRNPRLDQIEDVLLRLSDIPGVTRAAAVPKLGADGTRGAVRLFINMERAPLDIVAFADNRQAPLAGRGLYGVVAAWNSWSDMADSTALSVFGSGDFDDPFPEDFTERFTVQLEHQRHLTAGGAALQARALYSETRPGGEVKAFDIFGSQAELELALVTPLLRSRALSVTGRAGVEIVEMDGELPGTSTAPGQVTANDSIRAVELALSVEQRDAFGAAEAAFEARAGLPILGASSAGEAGLSRSDGDGTFFLVRGRAARTLVHPAVAPLEFWAELSGQWADRPLLSYEEFAIGGPTLGRAFDPTEYAGDLGVGLAGEVRIPTTFDAFDARIDATFYGFADIAKVRNLEGGAPSVATLASAGLGVRSALPYGFALNLEAARPLNQPLQRTQSKAWRFFFSASREF
ncbi:ShlB/FhaC/HecB family hemolysin secretion/activation protein [Rhodovulum sp. DZ06]|uniref:ShlB/FhaC/HecB family hemolysin secretion/activation protein n=1 Tax=Rhodovulum sp. DZ06 TaxID=3425126 RepID=UPI003D345E2F